MNKKAMPALTEKELLSRILQSCSDAKGIDLVALNVKGHFDLANKFIIVTARSDRHAQGISNRIMADLEKFKINPLSVEGYNKGHWVLLDYSDIIIHVFYKETREVYDLDKLWSKAEKIDVEKILETTTQEAA